MIEQKKEWIAEDGTFIFGKYKGCTLEYVSKYDLDYLHWILDSVADIVDEDRKIIEVHLKRRGHE